MEHKMEMEIKKRYGDLRSSEKKAADYILKHMDDVQKMSLRSLSKACGVSQPTVIRMVRAVGFEGYKEFKTALIMEMAKQPHMHHEISGLMYGYSFSEEDRIEDVPAKMVMTTTKIMEENLKSISLVTFRKVIEALNQARMIDIYGVENSNVTAKDLLTKLLYLGLNCRYMEDYYHQRICASNLTAEDVAVGISYSGSSKDTVEAMKAARKSGATTIVITNFKDSIISRYADLLICTSQEQLFYGDAIFSRTTQMLLVDMIYMGLLTSNYERYSKRLDLSSKVIRDKAYVQNL